MCRIETNLPVVWPVALYVHVPKQNLQSDPSAHLGGKPTTHTMIENDRNKHWDAPTKSTLLRPAVKGSKIYDKHENLSIVSW